MAATSVNLDSAESSVTPDVKARSRTKLLAAATELLVEGGPQSVTVDAVAERSGVAKSTLYRHFRSVDELLLAVMRANVPHTMQLDLSAGFHAAMREWMDNAVVALSAPDWPRVLSALLELRASRPEMAELLEADFADKHAVLAELLNIGAAEGAIPAGLDVHLVTQALVGPLVLAALSGDTDRAPELAQFVLDRFLASYRD